MKDDDFRHEEGAIDDRRDDTPARGAARGLAEGIRTQASHAWEGDDDYRNGPEVPGSDLGNQAGLSNLPKPKKSYAAGGTVTPDQILLGAPTTQRDNMGNAVNPMMSAESGGTQSGNASPFSSSMSLAEGGAIPDGDGDDDGDSSGSGDTDSDSGGLGGETPDQGAPNGTEQDSTTQAFSTALKAVNAGLMYGRQKHGLPTGNDQSQGQDKSGAIPDDNTDDSGDESDAAPAFAEGGAVPDDNDVVERTPETGENSGGADQGEAWSPNAPDNSGAAPVDAAPQAGAIPDDNSGAAPVDAADPQEQNKAQQTPLAYLMGADGVAPQVLDHYKSDTNGTEADRNLQAVDKAYQDGGDQGAFGVIQALRQKFDRFMNHGRAALNQGDMANAAKSATQAMDNLPDGKNVVFQPTKDGLVARIHGGSEQPNTVPLSAAAADAFMNTGKLGQFDGLLENGVNTAMKAATSTPAAPAAPQLQTGTGYMGKNGLDKVRGLNNAASQVNAVGRSGGQGAAQAPQPGGAGPNSEADRSVKMGHDVTLLRASDKYKRLHPNSDTPENLNAQVRVMSPNDRVRTFQNGNKISDTGEDVINGKKGRGSSGSGQAGIEREKLKQDALNEREKMRFEHNTTRDTARNSARTTLEQQKAMAAIDRLSRGSDDKRMQELAKTARTVISNPNFGMQTDEQRNAIYKQFGIDKMMQQGTGPSQQQAPQQRAPQQAPAQQQPAQQQAPQQRPANVPQGAKQYNGKWYTRGPNGEAVPVQ
jgi:hypothetical protein